MPRTSSPPLTALQTLTSGPVRRHSPVGLRHLHRLLLTVAATMALALTWHLASAEPAAARLSVGTDFGPVPGNPVEALADTPMDEARYDRATHCVRQPKPGAVALAQWLATVSPQGTSWGIVRCEMWGKRSASLHAEGRAVDWHLDARKPAHRAEAERLIRLLLAPDSAGNPHALARRMGVQGLIWNCQSWWGGPSLQRYSPCNGKDGKLNPKVNFTLAHRDHIHLELTKPGALLRTSWWALGPGRPLARQARRAR